MQSPRTLLFGLYVLVSLGWPTGPVAFARETWSEIGDVQILEGPDKIWVFVEVVRITDFTNEPLSHLMSRHPERRIVSRSAFTVDRLGNVNRITMAGNSGPGLDPDLEPIFRYRGAFYQYKVGSLGRPAAFYRWSGDRFAELQADESTPIRKELRGAKKAGLPDELLELEAITERDGWRILHPLSMRFAQAMEAGHDPHAVEASLPRDAVDAFESGKQQARIIIRDSHRLSGWRKLRRSAIVASSISKTDSWSRTLIEVDTSSQRARRKSSR